jgi:flagellar motility protein MotE (MotC chaperone)
MAKRKIEVMEEEQEKQEVIEDQQTASLRAKEQLRSLVKRHDSIREKIKSLSVENLSKTLNAMQGNNPAVRIRLNANILKLEVIAVKLKQRVYHAYIDFLAQMDVLQQRPMINYLSPGLKPMEN